MNCSDETEGDRSTVQATSNVDSNSSLEESQGDRTTGQSTCNADITSTRLYYPELVVPGEEV